MIPMKTNARTQQAKETLSNKQPANPRAYGHESRRVAEREEIRRHSPVLNAPRQTKRPVERSNQRRSH
jgi:hypothetical protein